MSSCPRRGSDGFPHVLPGRGWLGGFHDPAGRSLVLAPASATRSAADRGRRPGLQDADRAALVRRGQSLLVSQRSAARRQGVHPGRCPAWDAAARVRPREAGRRALQGGRAGSTRPITSRSTRSSSSTARRRSASASAMRTWKCNLESYDCAKVKDGDRGSSSSSTRCPASGSTQRWDQVLGDA